MLSNFLFSQFSSHVLYEFNTCVPLISSDLVFGPPWEGGRAGFIMESRVDMHNPVIVTPHGKARHGSTSLQKSLFPFNAAQLCHRLVVERYGNPTPELEKN